MCGIAGVIGQIDEEAVALLNTSVQSNMSRGFRGFGILAISQSGSAITSHCTSADLKVVQGMIAVAAADPEVVALFVHTKAPTTKQNLGQTLHPVRYGHLSLMHNGLIPNWRHHDIGASFDSEMIVRKIVKTGLSYLQDLGAILTELGGQHACVLFDHHTEILRTWSAQAPLYVDHFEKFTHLGSTGLFPSSRRLEEGRIFIIDYPKTFERGPVGLFAEAPFDVEYHYLPQMLEFPSSPPLSPRNRG